MEQGRFEILEKEEQREICGGEQKGITLFDSVKDFFAKLFGMENPDSGN